MLPLRFGRTMSLAKTPGSLVRFTFRLEIQPTPRGFRLQRQVLDVIHQLREVTRFRDEFEVRDESPDADTKLMRVDDAGEFPTGCEMLICDDEEVFVLRHERSV